MNKEFNIKTNASNVGIGAVLSQDYEINGEVHHLPIAYASPTLTPSEQNYSTTNQEGLAVVWALKKFKSYIYGTHFTIITDHNHREWVMYIVHLEYPETLLAYALYATILLI